MGTRITAIAAAASFVLLAALPAPAAAEMENCSQTDHQYGLVGSALLHFAQGEDCFADPDAKFTGYSVLITNTSGYGCDADLGGGVFTDRGGWTWSYLNVYHFEPFETREVKYDFRGLTDFPVRAIRVLYNGTDIQVQCGGALEVRYTVKDPLPKKGTYFNTRDKDAFFRIYSEDFARPEPEASTVPRPVSSGLTIVRFPFEGLNTGTWVLPYDFFSDVRVSSFVPVADDPETEEDESLRHRFLSQYHLEHWDPAASVWETLDLTAPKDVTDKAVLCGDGEVDCFGDKGVFKRVFPDGHYRIRARHRWTDGQWWAWSQWREFHVRNYLRSLPDPEARRPLWQVAVDWITDRLLGERYVYEG